MENDAWSIVVNTAIATFKKVKRPLKLWLVRPLVVIVGSISTGVVVALWSVPELWTSSVWDEE